MKGKKIHGGMGTALGNTFGSAYGNSYSTILPDTHRQPSLNWYPPNDQASSSSLRSAPSLLKGIQDVLDSIFSSSSPNTSSDSSPIAYQDPSSDTRTPSKTAQIDIESRGISGLLQRAHREISKPVQESILKDIKELLPTLLSNAENLDLWKRIRKMVIQISVFNSDSDRSSSIIELEAIRRAIHDKGIDLFGTEITDRLERIRDSTNALDIEILYEKISFLGLYPEAELLLHSLMKSKNLKQNERNEILDDIKEILYAPVSSTKIENDNVYNIQKRLKLLTITVSSVLLVTWLRKWNVKPFSKAKIVKTKNGYGLSIKTMDEKRKVVPLQNLAPILIHATRDDLLEPQKGKRRSRR